MLRCRQRHPKHGDTCHREMLHEGRCYNIVTSRHWGDVPENARVIGRYTKREGWYKRKAITASGAVQFLVISEHGIRTWLPDTHWVVVSELDSDADAVFTAPPKAVADSLIREGIDPSAMVKRFHELLSSLRRG